MNTKNPGSKETAFQSRYDEHAETCRDHYGRKRQVGHQGRGLPRIAGHKKGTDAVRRVTDYCRHLGISVLTLYAFSDENWGKTKRRSSFPHGQDQLRL